MFLESKSEIVVSAILDLVSENQNWKPNSPALMGQWLKCSSFSPAGCICVSSPTGVLWRRSSQIKGKAIGKPSDACLLSPRLVPRNCHFAHTVEGLFFPRLPTPRPPWPFSLSTEAPSFSTLKPSQRITLWCDYTLDSQKFIAGKDLRNKPPSPSLRRWELSPLGSVTAQSHAGIAKRLQPHHLDFPSRALPLLPPPPLFPWATPPICIKSFLLICLALQSLLL